MSKSCNSGVFNPRAKLTEEDVVAIRASTKSAISLGIQYGVHAMTISRIRSRKSWAHVK